MFSLFAAILFTTLLSLFYYFRSRTLIYWKLKKIPGPAPVPIFGNLKDAVLRKLHVGTVAKELYDDYPKEKVIGVYRMMTPSLLIRDLDVIKHITIKDFDQFVDRGINLSDEKLGENLFSANEKLWRSLRGRFTPLFTTAKLKNMMYLIVDKGDSLIDYVNSRVAEQTEQNVYAFVQRYTIASISACAFGIDVDIHNDEYMKRMIKLDRLIFTRNIVQELFFMIPGLRKMLNIKLVPKEVTDFFSNLVKNVVKLRKNAPSDRKDFMDLILELRQRTTIASKHEENSDDNMVEITDDTIAAQAFVFYIAGYETSATTMMFTMYELAMNPDIQEKVISEVDDAITKCNGNVTYDTIANLPYMEKVFDETLRKYPIIPILQRISKTDYQVPGTDVVLEKGRVVLLSPLGVHYDEKYYSDPMRFDPERFSAENIAKRHPCAYFPFGLGPRNCIGLRFAKVQSRICLLKFFSKFRLQPTKNTPSYINFDPYRSVLSPGGGMHLNVIPRHK